MINLNYEVILRYIYENESSLEEIMKGLKQSHIDIKLSTVRFVIDLFNTSKQLQVESKQEFFTQLVKPELLSILVEIMAYKEGPTAGLIGNQEEIVKAIINDIVEAAVSSSVVPLQHAPEGIHQEVKEKQLKIEGEDGMHAEFEIKKLDLLKVNVAEILTGCFQILPSKVMLRSSFTRGCKAHSIV